MVGSSGGSGVVMASSTEEEKKGGGSNDDDDYLKVFFDACAYGKVDEVNDMLKEDESLATAVTVNGESCLHLSAVAENGLDVVKALVAYISDPEDKKKWMNLRVTHDAGLRMTPLAWMTWHNRLPTIQFLLATTSPPDSLDINMDFDLSPMGPARVTATDIAYTLTGTHTEKNKDNELVQTQIQMYQLLLDHGGKLYEELHPQDTEHIMSRERTKQRNDEETYGL
eukprot:CAMPEP_0197823922 /NCGR_PEP_ID=MMETSP1437-20131217/1242_1 /TAXON_ID=49252 ORGANISM="Eucampia antarctica, Strain CCMP1452" /NCGR_SAMPLE_ID=MMETSP1437 /ASSEMBLY_ACC=CAM_ASM_001096 /LENGTH=224 /DNA_ID=CAMNT_0043423335 /DNA_START=136 /DNA_END=810 /DNA_ORIENTATION=+